MAYGQTNVNSGARGGEFLVGNLNYFTVKTVVPCYPTNVKTPLAQALAARNFTSLSDARTITVVDGNGAEVTYASNAAYTSAYNKQQNLNTLLNVFASRVNPVVVNVSASVVADPSAANSAFASGGVADDEFGSDYNDANTAIYTISLVIEKAGSWLVSGVGAGTNDAGYQLLNVINGVAALNTTATTPAGPQDEDAIATNINFPASLVYVVDGASNGNNIVAKLSDSLPVVI
jgi:hypothetical protein